MRWTRVLILLLILGFTVLAFVFLSPLLFLHHSAPGWVLHLQQMLFPGGNPMTDLAQGSIITTHPQASGDVMSQPYTWVLLSGMGLMYVLLSIDSHVKRYTYGSARYAPGRDARRLRAPRAPSWLVRGVLFAVRTPLSLAVATVHNARHTLQQRAAPLASWFHVGIYQHQMIALSEKEQEEHLLVTAPNGAGKTSLEIIPNLLCEAGSRSLFIVDLKNELYRITAGAVARQHEVWRFCPSQPALSHSYNPLAYVKTATDANMLADCWVKNTGESDDDFWPTNSRHLIGAVILHLRVAEPNAPFARVSDLITGETFDDLTTLLTKSPSPEARRKIATFLHNLKRNERLVGSTMVEVGNRFQLFDEDKVRTATALNEIDFEAMIDTPTALYLSIPPGEVKLYRPLLACFTMQMFRTWEQRAANSATGTLPRGIACYLDEFANLGYIPDYDTFVSTARYLRVSLLMVIQNFSQLDERYGPHVAETIRDNANTHLVLPGAGQRECRYYSERIGDTTVPTLSRTSRGGGGLFSTTDESWTQGEARRPLLTPDEIRTMAPRSVLMLRSSLQPMLLKAKPYYEDRRLAHLANLPYHLTHIRTAPPAATPTSAQQPPHASTQHPPIVVEADKDSEDDQQHFLADE